MCKNVTDFRPGQSVEVYIIAANECIGKWVRAVLLPRGGLSQQWTFRYSDGRNDDQIGFSVERWIRPLSPLIQLAEVCEED